MEHSAGSKRFKRKGHKILVPPKVKSMIITYRRMVGSARAVLQELTNPSLVEPYTIATARN